jgi:hypothetical protein
MLLAPLPDDKIIFSYPRFHHSEFHLSSFHAVFFSSLLIVESFFFFFFQTTEYPNVFAACILFIYYFHLFFLCFQKGTETVDPGLINEMTCT